MTTTAPTNGSTGERLLRLSDLIHRRVLIGGDKIGSLFDLVIVDKGVVAEVTHVCVRQPFGRPQLFVPWASVQELDDKAVILDPQVKISSLGDAPSAAVLLEDYIVDKKVLDVEGREVEVVYDVTLALKSNRLYVVGVDLSRRALLRRIGLKWLANFTASITDRMENDLVAWDLVEPLPEGIGSFAGDLRLKVVKEQLVKMPPVDVARILEQLSGEQQMAVFNSLEPARASDALEELDPKSQRDVIAAMSREKAARLIDAMTPGQAADVLAVLPWSYVHSILGLLEADKAAKVQEILEDQDQKIANFVSADFITVRRDSTVRQAKESVRLAREREAVAYLYVLDNDDHLLGVISTMDLLTAGEDVQMKAMMQITPVTLSLEGTLKEASELFGRYGYRALPVVDRHGKMHGIIPHRDVMSLKYHDLE
jgi:CBS domain-containing protein/sporulation protein YlmC with PRC-barrel domain